MSFSANCLFTPLGKTLFCIVLCSLVYGISGALCVSGQRFQLSGLPFPHDEMTPELILLVSLPDTLPSSEGATSAWRAEAQGGDGWRRSSLGCSGAKARLSQRRRPRAPEYSHSHCESGKLVASSALHGLGQGKEGRTVR